LSAPPSGAGIPPAEAYRAAGVDRDEAGRAVSGLGAIIARTRTARVTGSPGGFAGFFAYPEADSDRLLVASMDGVGTKLKLAAAAGRYRGAGIDIVSHCVDDILVHGATPLFFLDYIGAGRLSAAIVAELAEGMAEACVEAGRALIGGETAEMPGIYAAGELDLVGTIIGEVRREALVDGHGIQPGDRILGLRSSGLHTNGYSLVRRILSLDDHPERLLDPLGDGRTWGDALLAPHRMYLSPVRPVLGLVRGMAHITGGGITENLPRVLPEGIRAVIRRDAWETSRLFDELRRRGRLDDEECYRVFNMGLGFLLVVAPELADHVRSLVEGAGEPCLPVGWCEAGERSVRWAAAGERGA